MLRGREGTERAGPTMGWVNDIVGIDYKRGGGFAGGSSGAGVVRTGFHEPRDGDAVWSMFVFFDPARAREMVSRRKDAFLPW